MKQDEKGKLGEGNAASAGRLGQTVADAALAGGELTQQIGELAKAVKPTNRHVFTVLNVLVAGLLIGKEEEYAKAALAWLRYETMRESSPPSSTRQGDGLDKAPAPGAAPREPLDIGPFSGGAV